MHLVTSRLHLSAIAALALTAHGALAHPQRVVPESIWMEAESFGPLRGANFSFMPVEQETRGSWSIAGPDTAPSWTQGGESGFLSVAARADEPGELSIGRAVLIPAAGEYTLWVRYADYRRKKAEFGVRITQGDKIWTHRFGTSPVADAMDPLMLMWGWLWSWDSASAPLAKGSARVELFTTGPTEARRCIDCLCLTTDSTYHPLGRQKPDCPAWAPLRALRAAATAPAASTPTVPAAWQTTTGPPAFLWNVGQPWLDELRRPPADRVSDPFGVDPPLLPEFLKAFRGKQPAVYSDPLSGPVWHIPLYPAALASGSPFAAWMDANPDRRFGILLNYADPSWPAGADRAETHRSLMRYGDRFVGFIAGENLDYADVDTKALNAKIAAAQSRAEVLKAIRDAHTAAVRKKFGDYYGAPVTAEEAWAPVIPCLSVDIEAFAHALCGWGVRRVGHENTGNSPVLGMRLAFLRGAARQFGARFVDYQSCNLGDAATMYSREAFFYPGSSRYVLDNQYDVWAGAGINWLWKDYVLWYLAGVDAFYNEQGVDIFWKPGGNSAGDGFPVSLSPKGLVASEALGLAHTHRAGTQYTPVAFLLDEAHGWSEQRYQYGAFGLDPQLNPSALTPGAHEASIRGWMDIAYYPAPETQNEPASAIRQTYVSGVFGDIFDALVTTPGRSAAAGGYKTIIAAGEVNVSEDWGKALLGFVNGGGTLVVCAGQFHGPGAASLRLPGAGAPAEATGFRWSDTGETVASGAFQYEPLESAGAKVLAAAADGAAIAVERPMGKGRIVVIGIPLGLCLDQRPSPLLSLLMIRITRGLMPVTVLGDVEWTVNRLPGGGWAVALLNNRGVNKPQHGVLPTDRREDQTVHLTVTGPQPEAREWISGTAIRWDKSGTGFSATLLVPAGAVRIVPFTLPPSSRP